MKVFERILKASSLVAILFSASSSFAGVNVYYKARIQSIEVGNGRYTLIFNGIPNVRDNNCIGGDVPTNRGFAELRPNDSSLQTMMGVAMLAFATDKEVTLLLRDDLSTPTYTAYCALAQITISK